MSTLKKRIVKATALALALAVTHVCLSAELVQAASARLIAKATAAQGGAQGRLTTRGNNPVTVNGNSAKSGETIFPGQSIQTPEGVGATVNLPGLGRVDIAPNSNLTLTFGDGKIDVVLVSGCAILTANKGTAGSLEAGGTPQRTEGDKGGVLDVCNSKMAGAAPIAGQGAAAAAGAGAAGGAATATTAAAGGGLFGLGTAGTVGFITAAGVITAAAIIAPCRRGPNPSPGDPRGRNDECRE
ncbi:MAG: hypothetical protein QOH49_1775 [Acidobacteriota bacterium]|jgi:hypothetical protein|nr:hypothetical protein [Acidobacteriota bacterium]